MSISRLARRTPVTATVVTTAADQVAYADLLDEQRRWIEREMGVRLDEMQPAAVEEYADPFSYYAGGDVVGLLARAGRFPTGIAAVKPLGGEHPGAVELKRVFVRESARGYGAGRALVEAAIDLARSGGAGRVVLETHEGYMARAVALYRDVGFVETTSALGVTQHPGVVTMELDLRDRCPAP